MLRKHQISELAIAQEIDGYGCWCYFDESYRNGKGIVMNEIDEICKILHDGYKCAIVDCNAEGKGDCEPWNVDYVSSAMSSFNGLISGCTNANAGNMCAIRACIVEGWFANAVLDIFTSQHYVHEPGLLHANGFDKELNCVGSHPPPDPNSKVQCCGEFPHRYPYQDLGGERACCGQVVYSTMLYDCCPNDMVSVSC